MSFFTKARRLWSAPWLEKMTMLGEAYWLIKSQCYYKRFFGKMGRGSKVINPVRLSNVQNIFIEERVLINHQAFLLTRALDPGRLPRLVIDSGAVIGHFNHITCVDSVYIGKNVLTADRVHISDNSHGFDNPETPIMDQPVASRGKVSIGDGTWIGENASIQSCSIGRHCVIGSNSVVIRDIPNYCVAAGVPARILRRLDPETGIWERVSEKPHSSLTRA